jgi:hypothetical protein
MQTSLAPIGCGNARAAGAKNAANRDYESYLHQHGAPSEAAADTFY